MASDQVIIANITQTLKTSLPDWFGPGTRLITEALIRSDRPYAVFLHCDVHIPHAKDISLILKIIHDENATTLQEAIDSGKSSNFPTQEAEMMQQIETAVSNSGNPHLTAIPIIAYLPNYCTIVMVHIPMKTFKQNYLGKPSALHRLRDLERMEQQAYLAGQWLKLFHTTFRKEEQVAPQNDILKQTVFDLVERLIAVTSRDHQHLLEKILSRCAVCEDIEQPWTVLHNDLHLNNIFITADGKVGGFDPNPGPHGSIYTDIAHAITDCATQRKQVFTLGLFFQKNFIERIKVNFLNGYDAKVDQNLLGLYCGLAVLEKWVEAAELTTGSKNAKIPGAKTFRQLLYSRHFSQLVDEYFLSS